MAKRVLVGYATGAGSTVGVAEKIGETLSARGMEVDVKPVKNGVSLSGYDAVVLGSAVNGGQWLSEALAFVERNRSALAKLPVAVFCVHAMNAGDDAKATARRRGYLDKVRTLINPVEEGYFLGVAPVGDSTFFLARFAFRAFGGCEGDCRDYEAIRAWAQKVAV